MPSPCITAIPTTYVPPTADARILNNFTRRYNTAYTQAHTPAAAHPVNTDEALSDKCASYSKCVLQDSPGKVNLAAYAAFKAAIAAGTFAAFDAVPVGGPRTLNGPMGAFASQFLGADSSQYGAPAVPAPPSLSSPLYATELIELYWCSFLRDIAFADYATNPIAQQAAAELSALPLYQGPRNGTTVTPALLFRGAFAGENVGPYVSQLLVTPTNFGAQPFSQQYITYIAGTDYMTELHGWFEVQNGAVPPPPVKDPINRYLRNGRSMSSFTHVDELYQSYFTAYLVLESTGVPANPGNPYNDSLTQNGFGTFGRPDIASVLAQVAKCALNACWYQKWVVHLRHRPEAGGGMVHMIKTGAATFSATPDMTMMNASAVLPMNFSLYDSYLLSQPFPEGSPAHPAYPTGHGAVGGACITILKFFYDGDYVFPNPMLPMNDGTELHEYHPDASIGDPGPLTLNGELHKLAHNITFGHGLHGGIHWRTDSDASMMLGEAVAISFLQDLACTYHEPFKITFTKLDGTPQTISNM
jgi:hypothetical protein